MGALSNQLVAFEGTISHSAPLVTVMELADLVSGQSLSSFLGHIFSMRAARAVRSLRSADH
jgi:ubiquinone biosynthesis protein UbiJ